MRIQYVTRAIAQITRRQSELVGMNADADLLRSMRIDTVPSTDQDHDVGRGRLPRKTTAAGKPGLQLPNLQVLFFAPKGKVEINTLCEVRFLNRGLV